MFFCRIRGGSGGRGGAGVCRIGHSAKHEARGRSGASGRCGPKPELGTEGNHSCRGHSSGPRGPDDVPGDFFVSSSPRSQAPALRSRSQTPAWKRLSTKLCFAGHRKASTHLSISRPAPEFKSWKGDRERERIGTRAKRSFGEMRSQAGAWDRDLTPSDLAAMHEFSARITELRDNLGFTVCDLVPKPELGNETQAVTICPIPGILPSRRRGSS